MCGIGGVLRLQGVRPDELERMGALMKHRGPDDEGYCLVESDGRFRCFSGDDTVEPRSELDHITQTVSNCSLGMVHRRLSILDTGPAGHQPMVLQGRYVLIYNGEIYNYRELRSDLTSENCSFHSLSDSEVLLNAFAKWGQGALHRFIGMWAFAIYDKQEHKLTLCRDRFGIKPLYFVSRKGFFAFASEIKPLLQLDECSKNARIEACIEYIAFGSNANPDMTLFRDVSEVPPAAFMHIDCRTGEFTTHAYYNLSDMIKNQEGVNTLPFARQLHESVCLHLRSDVPLGSCLSGGLDSSAIVYLASQEIEGLYTFTASYPGDEVDEARFASAVATHCGNVKGHCTYPAPADYWQEVGEMLRHQEQPVNSTSPYAQWCVMRLAKETGMKVLLDGQGADEILGGYYQFAGIFLLDLLRGFRFRKAAKEYRLLKKRFTSNMGSASGRAVYYFLPSMVQRWLRSKNRLGMNMLHRDYLRLAGAIAVPQRGGKSFAEFSLSGMRFGMRQLLRYEDRNSMAFSIESRVPFLDHRLVEAALALPAEMKIREGWTKFPLRNMLSNHLPDTVVWRRDKLGFVTPQARWKNELQGNVRDYIHQVQLPPMINREYLLELCSMELQTSSQQSEFWRAFSFLKWAEVMEVTFP